MGDKYENLKRKANKIGMFGDYEMFGYRYERESGKDGWLITAWAKGRDPVRTYWVEEGEFLSARVHYGINLSNLSLVETFSTPPEIAPEARKAIMQAITEWGQE